MSFSFHKIIIFARYNTAIKATDRLHKTFFIFSHYNRLARSAGQSVIGLQAVPLFDASVLRPKIKPPAGILVSLPRNLRAVRLF